MGANIAGATNGQPGVYTDIVTLSNGAAVPGGSRVAAMIGEGSTPQTVISQAQGGGVDGLDPTYSTTTGADGRHFLLNNAPLVSNRTTLFKNGIPLVGSESVITTTITFSDNFDYLLDPNTGEILLQSAHLKDQGGTFYVPLSTNVGLGVLNSLSLVDNDAPPETWTIRCVSVQRNAMSQPIAGTASFLAYGSVSGPQVDANGNPIVWIANNNVVSNGILSFAIQETSVGGVATSPFVPGDGFTVIVASGVLVRNDSLTATYIPVSLLNTPLQTFGMTDVVSNFGQPSTASSTSNGNNLSLGCQLAYANSASNIICLQAAPPLPRRTSYILSPAVNFASTDVDDYVFPLPLGVVPDFNSNIHVFTTNNSTKVETQILPNKLTYYTLGTAGQPTESSFIFDNNAAPAGHSYFYTVIQSMAVDATGTDGYLGRSSAFTNQGIFSSSIVFDSTYVGKTLKIIDSVNAANIATYTVNSVANGDLYVTHSSFMDFTSQTPTTFQVISIATGLPVLSGTDGVLVDLVGTATATLHSTATSFAGIGITSGYRLQINGSTVGNNGLYDIIGYSSGTNTITIQMAVVTEHNLRYEVLDPTLTSNYIVFNHNTVPNGYGLRVTIVDARDAPFYDAGWINALEALQTIECDIVVPLPTQTYTVIFQNALNHCLSMSNILNRKERVLFMGAIQGLTPANVIGTSPAAVENLGILEGIQGNTVTEVLAGNIEDLANYSVPDAYGRTYRCVYFYPDQITVQAGSDNVVIDGFYIAAAAAGYAVADIIIQNPLTNKVFSGLTIPSTKQFNPTTLQNLLAAGIAVLQPVSGGGNVIWGCTTTQSGYVEEQEISIVFIRDRVAKSLRAGFAGYIGIPQTINTAAILNTRATDLLNSFVAQGLITAFTNLSVNQDSVNPTQWDISVSIQPAYPLNFIYIVVPIGQLTSA
jgi:hypothetical protein